jgi:hypothetical protein
VLAGAERLAWNDPALAVSSDTSLRRPYRLLQSWYREHVLGADRGYVHRGGGTRPVGSLLAEWEVDADRALNFLGDQLVLDYVDARVPVVVAAGGTLEEHRLRHNMLSSMPMAFTLIGALRSADDRDGIVAQMFGVPIDGVAGAEAEWVPPGQPRADLLADRTAVDAVIKLSGRGGSGPIIGVETKYTEPLSATEYFTDRLVEVTEACDWFLPGAAEQLRHRSTNQLWREALLTWLAGGSESYLAVIGLRDDASLWRSVELLQSHMARPDRILARSWEEVIRSWAGTSLESFGLLFEERYLDTSPVEAS